MLEETDNEGREENFNRLQISLHKRIYCWRRKWQPTPELLPGKFHRLKSLVGYSPWGPKESDMTE